MTPATLKIQNSKTEEAKAEKAKTPKTKPRKTKTKTKTETKQGADSETTERDLRSPRVLTTRQGDIPLPTYIPVTTFGGKYPLDDLIRPYLPRLASAMMVSYHYAKAMAPESRPRIPLCVDSGGFAALFPRSTIRTRKGLGILEIQRDEDEGGTEVIQPKTVLEFQEAIADVAFTLDFPIPPGLDLKEAQKRQTLTIANAHWALANRRRQDLCLFACVQAWDVASARTNAKAYVGKGFDGVAIGGLVPRVRDRDLVLEIVAAVREEIGDLPLHVFGLGNPALLSDLYGVGADSVDSSSYVQYAADGCLWGRPNAKLEHPSPTDRLHLALCNLAIATGKSLPLSSAQLLFSTLRTGSVVGGKS